jgi:hypothetical protein
MLLVSALVLGIAVILVVSGVGGMTPLYIWVAVQAAILVSALLAERGRYRPPASGAEHNWQRTAERFQDPTTGRWVVVEYNLQTGERRYMPEENG